MVKQWTKAQVQSSLIYSGISHVGMFGEDLLVDEDMLRQHFLLCGKARRGEP